MAMPTNPHDKFFRSSMLNAPVAQAFFQHYLPTTMLDNLELDSFHLENSTYIDEALRETLSDLVFTCRYSKNVDSVQAKVVLLVEHQSTPDQFMPFRVYHYLFNMLYNELKGRTNKQAKLPAVYALVFYHGKQTPYPFSMNLADCFDDPLGIMDTMFMNPVPLIDVNQVQDDEVKKQQLLGIMTGALKHSRDADIGNYIIWLLENLQTIDLTDQLTLQFIRTALIYMFGVGNIKNPEQLIKDAQRLPEPVRGEIMTAAEKFQAMGEERGLKKGHEIGLEKGLATVAINLLNEGAEPRFVERITGLELAFILELKAKLKTQLEGE
jgi:predicted transposase/invertase (TIGR01784 family)